MHWSMPLSSCRFSASRQCMKDRLTLWHLKYGPLNKSRPYPTTATGDMGPRRALSLFGVVYLSSDLSLRYLVLLKGRYKPLPQLLTVQGTSYRSSDRLRSTIGNISTAFGAPSISRGVMHHGRPVFHGQGFTNLERSMKPDLDTVYLVASCNKAFTTAACAILVEEGKLSLTEPVRF